MTRRRIPLSLPEAGTTAELRVLQDMEGLPVEARAEILTLAAMRLAALPRPPKRLLKQIALVMPESDDRPEGDRLHAAASAL